MEPVARGWGMGCAVFMSSSSIPEAYWSVGLFLSIICGVPTVYSSLRPQHSLCLGHALLWNHSRERHGEPQACSMPTHHSLLGNTLLPDANHMAKALLSSMQG